MTGLSGMLFQGDILPTSIGLAIGPDGVLILSREECDTSEADEFIVLRPATFLGLESQACILLTPADPVGWFVGMSKMQLNFINAQVAQLLEPPCCAT